MTVEGMLMGMNYPEMLRYYRDLTSKHS
jgi:hypothetical protein